MQKKTLFLISGHAGHGKTEAGIQLQSAIVDLYREKEEPTPRINIFANADVLKMEAYSSGIWDGTKTPEMRKVMIDYGSSVKAINGNTHWAKGAFEALNTIVYSTKIAIVDDVRFDYEQNFFKEQDVFDKIICIKIDRGDYVGPGIDEANAKDPSEQLIGLTFDEVIINSGDSKVKLYEQMKEIAQKYI